MPPAHVQPEVFLTLYCGRLHTIVAPFVCIHAIAVGSLQVILSTSRHCIVNVTTLLSNDCPQKIIRLHSVERNYNERFLCYCRASVSTVELLVI